MAMTGGDKLRARLEKMAQSIEDAGKLRVGFLKNATYPDGTKVAQVAYENEFGRHGKPYVPPRPYFRNMIAARKGQWAKAISVLMKSSGHDAGRALPLLGEFIKGDLQQSIRDFTTPGNAPFTIRKKGFDKPLIDTGHMLRSVDYEVQK